MNRKPEQGCLSSTCWFASDRSGQRVNGPCTCLDRVPLQQRLVIKKYVYNLKKQLAEARAEINIIEHDANVLIGDIKAELECKNKLIEQMRVALKLALLFIPENATDAIRLSEAALSAAERGGVK